MTTKTGIIFDMDGTLIDSSAAVPDAFIKTVAEFGLTVQTREEIVALYHIGPPKALFSHLLGYPTSAAVIDAYHRNLAVEAQQVQPYDGIVALLEALQPQVKLGVYTGGSHGAAEILLGITGLIDYFDVFVGGDEVEHPKPAPDGLFKAFGALSLDPKEGVYIGDSPYDIDAARRAGALPIGAGWGHLFEKQDGEVVANHPLEVLEIVNITNTMLNYGSITS
ncbi:MAG: HAD family hydrolase [Anaerolineae bacterium]|nr:HAD family hydrolase [Anaerolineae bacterium]